MWTVAWDHALSLLALYMQRSKKKGKNITPDLRLCGPWLLHPWVFINHARSLAGIFHCQFCWVRKLICFMRKKKKTDLVRQKNNNLNKTVEGFLLGDWSTLNLLKWNKNSTVLRSHNTLRIKLIKTSNDLLFQKKHQYFINKRLSRSFHKIFCFCFFFCITEFSI